MNKSNWKGFERDVAKDFGGRRNPLSGGNSGVTRGDTRDTGDLFIECKKRKKLSVWTLFKQVEELAKREDKLPVVALKETGKHGYLLVIKPEDLIRVCGQYIRSAPDEETQSEEDKLRGLDYGPTDIRID